MLMSGSSKSASALPLDPLDRVAIAYLALPLVIFLAGWLEWWAALPLIASVAYALKPLAAPWPADGARLPITPLQLVLAVVVGIGWTIYGGAEHLMFANPDWHVRDAVLHDLVASPWPVGYGLLDGKESLLRAPVAFYLPAALVGKMAGLPAAHLVMAVWTAAGATLFLLQVLSLTPSRASTAARVSTAVMVIAVVVLFSGFDIIGCLLNYGGRFAANWDIAMHIEWWAGDYQYSSMTTQLFWVPNHALGGWLTIGLLCRNERGTPLERMLPIILVAAALWSPLTALGLIPFALWQMGATVLHDRSLSRLEPRVWAPSLIVGLVVAAYLLLDPTHIPKGLSVSADGSAQVTKVLLKLAQFFILEAGILGFAILAIRPSTQVVMALVILALLPLAYFGPGNDLVMRASIPSLAVLAIGACLALCGKSAAGALKKKWLLACLLVVGAVTPIQEFARAGVLRAWPINLDATLIGANCGTYAPHYVARLGDELIGHVLRQPHRMPLGPQDFSACDNPAIDLMHARHLL
jgi:hypothetical protein